MISTVFYERRKVGGSSDSNDQRIAQRRNGEKAFSVERRRLASQVRRYERESFKIPVHLKMEGNEISGYTHNISPEGLLVFCDAALKPGTPMSLQFVFGENVCYLNIAGQVVFCRSVQDNGSASHVIGIKFSAVRDWEQKILISAVQELKQNAATEGESLLTILVSKDMLAFEAADFPSQTLPKINEDTSNTNPSFSHSPITNQILLSKRQIDKSDRRSYLRVKEMLPINLVLSNNGTRKQNIFKGETLDIGLGGLSILTELVLPRIDKGIIEIHLPVPVYPMKARVKLKWRDDEKNYYGIQFINSSENGFIDWVKFVKSSVSSISDRRHNVDRRSDSNGTIDHLSNQEKRKMTRRITDLWGIGIFNNDKGSSITAADLLPKQKGMEYTLDAVKVRREWLSVKTGVPLKHIGIFSEDPQNMRGNVENLIGVAQIPIGMAGPMKVNGQFAKGNFYIPMATTEGALIYTLNQAMQIISLAGGATTTLLNDETHISPYFEFNSVKETRQFVRWIESNFMRIKEEAERTTRYGKLVRLEPHIFDKGVVIKFCYTTGDAMGINMITFATKEACRYIVPTVKPKKFYLQPNFSSIKKVTSHNFIMGCGKTVVSEVVIPGSLVKRVYNITAEEIVAFCGVVRVTTTHAGMIGISGHTANALAAIFIACGQDVASIVDSYICVTNFDLTKDNHLYVSIKLPCLLVGTVGGGTDLVTQRECLSLLGCYGNGQSKKFSEIIAASVLAGEIGLVARLANGTFAEGHRKYGRKATLTDH